MPEFYDRAEPPTEKEQARLLQRLLSGDASAAADLLSVCYPPLLKRLRRAFPVADEEVIQSMAFQTITDTAKLTKKFDPARGSLWSYLLRDADGDIRNELARLADLQRRRQQGRRGRGYGTPESDAEGVHVEDSERDWNTDVENEALERVHPRLLDWLPPGIELSIVLEHARDLVTNPTDEQMLHLIIDQERSTEPFAALLGITDLPIEEQRSLVKAHKDRLKQRVKRLRNLLTS